MSSKLNICNLAISHLGMRTIDQTELDALVTPSSKAFGAYYRFCRDDVFREFKWPFATVQRLLTEYSSVYDSDDDVSPPFPWGYAYEYPASYDIDDYTAWASGTTYAAGDIIKYNNIVYLSLLGSNLNKNPITQTTYWEAQTNVAIVWHVFNEATADKKDEQDFQVYLTPGSTDQRLICTNLEDAYMEYTFIVNDTTIWDAKFVMAISYRLAAAMAHTLTGDAQKGIQLMQIYNALLHETKRTSAIEKQKKPLKTSGYQQAR